MTVQEFIDYLQGEIAAGHIQPTDSLFAEWMEEWQPVARIERADNNTAYIYTD